MSANKSTGVRILNPAPHGSKYTSRKNAEHLVRRGLAAWDAGCSSISYLSGEFIRIFDRELHQRRQDDRMVEERGGVLWWNGCDHSPNACHRPGENVLIPRPDRAMPYIRAMERTEE